METIFVLLPLALLIAAVAVGFFVWAARTGQFDDLETPPVRMLFEDLPSPRPPTAWRQADEAVADKRSVSLSAEASAAGLPVGTVEATADSQRRVPK
jgi:cbb3-type cytochrome oxidase maturation protein